LRNEELVAKYKSRKKKQSMLPIALGAVGAFVVLAVVATMLSTDEGTVFGDVSVEGDGLPVFTATASDGAVGLAFPEIRGVGFDGEAVAITDDGRPKLLINLAHW
jgi:hypothetical protein